MGNHMQAAYTNMQVSAHASLIEESRVAMYGLPCKLINAVEDMTSKKNHCTICKVGLTTARRNIKYHQQSWHRSLVRERKIHYLKYMCIYLLCLSICCINKSDHGVMLWLAMVSVQVSCVHLQAVA